MSEYSATISWQRGAGEPFVAQRYSRAHGWAVGGGVRVRGGCRGEFAAADWGGRSPGYGRTVVCESVEQRLNRCNWDPRWGRPALIDQLSQDSCREGRSWGYDGREIWVDRGCRGRFGAR